MRYIADSTGYLLEVSFGAEIYCNGKSCTEYTGGVPSGYADLVDWFDKECKNLYRWKIVDGRLTLDSSVAIKTEPSVVFAPTGYGLSDIIPAKSITTTEQLDACRACGFYRYAIFSSKICGIGFNYGSLLVYPIYTDGCVQEVRPMNSNYCLRRFYFGSVWSVWELVGVVQVKLWENTNLTNNFPAQTISLDLSGYNYVYVEAVRSTEDNKISGHTRVQVGGLSGYLMGTTNQFALTRREVTATKTGVTFSGFSSANTSNGASNEIPYRIYGIKGVAEVADTTTEYAAICGEIICGETVCG